MTDGKNQTTTYGYSDFGKLNSMMEADNKAMVYKFDLNMNIAKVTDRNANDILYTYDNRNLTLSKSVTQTGDTISYGYDEVGNRVSMTDATGSSTYSYDANNHLLNVSKGGTTQISYTYDEVGNVLTVADRKSFTTTYSYDNSNRMSTVTFNGKTTTYNYDDNGNRLSTVYANGVSENYSYDKNNRLISLTNKTSGGSSISTYSYTYYDNGLQKTKVDQYGTTTYSYDGDGRITQVAEPGKTTIYAYDNAGNRQSLSETYVSSQPSDYKDTTSGTVVQYKVNNSQYTYSNTNRLLKNVESMQDGSGNELLQKITNYTFDFNGNEFSEKVSYVTTASGLQESYSTLSYVSQTTDAIDNSINLTMNTYDGFNRLTKVEIMKSGKKSITEYAYDGDDLRVSKTLKKSDNNYTPDITNFLYDRQHVILETDGTDAVKVRYVRGVNYIGRIDSSNNLSYFTYNGHGDVVQTVSEAGAVENQYDYDIFGTPTLAVEQYSCSIRYGGEYLDNETALYYLRARYYNSSIGRFISEDSYWGEDDNPLSLNLYTYSANDPIRFVDPSGHRYLQKGTKGDDVSQMQHMLMNLGYDLGSWGADGDFGKKTDEAVRKFQHDQRITEDGIVGPETMGRLQKAISPAKIQTAPAPTPQPVAPSNSGLLSYNPNQYDPRVVEVQLKLGITADGYFGTQTKLAVKSFQASHGLNADGVVGPLTQAKLNEVATRAPQQAPAAPSSPSSPAKHVNNDPADKVSSGNGSSSNNKTLGDKILDAWESTPIWKGLDTIANWEDQHPNIMSVIGIAGLAFEGGMSFNSGRIAIDSSTATEVDNEEKTYLLNNLQLLAKTPTYKLKSIWEEYTGIKATGEVHHGLPEEFKDWFAARGINVNSGEYFFDLPVDVHRLKAGNGVHTNNSPLGEEWNSAWERFIDQNPNASKKQIISRLNSMSKAAGINGYKAIKK